MNAADAHEAEVLARNAEGSDSVAHAARVVIEMRARFLREEDALAAVVELERIADSHGDREASFVCRVAAARMRMHPRTS